MQGKTNTGVRGGVEDTASLTVNAPVNVTVSVSKGIKTFTRSSGNEGVAKFIGLSSGTWKIKIEDDRGQTREKDVMIVADYNITIAFFEVSVTVNYPAGSTVIAQNDGETLNAPDTSGLWEAKLNKPGNWTFTATKGKDTDTKTINITEESRDIVVKLSFESIPVFTYTGNYEIVDDNDSPIITSKDNWKIRFLTSGDLQFTQLNGAEQGIDVFLVGGGGHGGHNPSDGYAAGGGGGGGYTTTVKNVTLQENKTYQITIGAEASATRGFEQIASGGKSGGTGSNIGGDGGSGGGGDGAGGSDGGNGVGSKGGKGQGATTREFGDPSGKLYAGGGGRGYGWSSGGAYNGGAGGGAAGAPSNETRATNAPANTGGGGGGGSNKADNGSSGGSGIVIIRNHRA